MPDADLALLLDTVREAGHIALAFDRTNLKYEHKSDGSFVTEADFAVDAFLKSRITAARPGDGWLSEETPDTPDRLTRTRVWIADPIDGTRGFLHGSGPWGIGMALVEQGRPTVSAILRPDDGLMFHGLRGEGCFCNGQRLQATTTGTLKQAQIIGPTKFRAAMELAEAHVETNSQLPLLLRLAAIAAGELAGAVSPGNKNDWDIAAGHLLVKEAGGRVTTRAGDEVIYNRAEPWQPGLVAAGRNLHSAILDIVRH